MQHGCNSDCGCDLRAKSY